LQLRFVTRIHQIKRNASMDGDVTPITWRLEHKGNGRSNASAMKSAQCRIILRQHEATQSFRYSTSAEISVRMTCQLRRDILR